MREAASVREEVVRLSEMESRAFATAVQECRTVFRLGRATSMDVRTGIALACVAAERALGLTPHTVQIAAALALNSGACVEMATGEGKTLAGALASTLAGWQGAGCHLITANDYLAQRDARTLAPMHTLLGVTSAAISGGSAADERRAAYARDITYCTSKEAAADALRDRLASRRWRTLGEALTERAMGLEERRLGERLLTRGQACAIVDEADAVLIDDAVTPLILSAPAANDEEQRILERAAEVADSLESSSDYTVDRRFSDIAFTARGLARIDERTADLPGVWSGVRRRRELVEQALRVREFFRRGEQYIVQDGKVVIVDESTGRLMPDRSWRQGIHQAIEAREGLPMTPVKDTLARRSFQRYFRGYRRMAGMTGTAREVSREMWSVYGLPVVTIPRNRPCVRIDRRPRCFSTVAARWRAIIDATVERHENGQPVLIGTRTVEASERCSRLLTESEIEHCVLNAVREAEEANIVRRAGERGAVTVATNMAGRGTDITLGAGVPELGGLCVIVSEPHQSARLDRQLMGRAGRQGDSGESLRFRSLADDLLLRQAPAPLRRLIGALPNPGVLGNALVRFTQRRAMRLARRQRLEVIRRDESLDESLGFAGPE